MNLRVYKVTDNSSAGIFGNGWYYIICKNFREAEDIFYNITCKKDALEYIKDNLFLTDGLSSLKIYKRKDLINYAYELGIKLKRLPGIIYQGRTKGTKASLEDVKFAFKYYS